MKSIELGKFKTDQTMLIIIDINNGFAKKGALYSPLVEAIVSPIVQLASNAIAKNVKTIAYTDYHPINAKEFNAYPSHCVAGTEESQLVKELLALTHIGLETKYKNSTNGLLAYNPAQEIIGIENYIVVGCVTDICVYQYATTLRAYLNEHNLEGRVIVSKAHVATYHIPEIHDSKLFSEMALKSMALNGVEIVDNIIS